MGATIETASAGKTLAGSFLEPLIELVDAPGRHDIAYAELRLVGADGEVEARAGFFDLTLDGRWGGLITGDKVQVDFGRCACGHQGPTVGGEITRFAELPGGDKITCAGTIDAYIRGVG